MRRTTLNCAQVAARQALLDRLQSIDPAAVTGVLENLVTADRRARLHAVFGARLDSVTVLMDAPHDPHNGAAVIRSCDAFGIQRLHVVERLEPFLSANSVSRGSERWVDTRTYPRTSDAVAALAQSGHELIATHPEGELDPEELASIPRLALVLGNERDGIGDQLRSACKRSVRIPMRGFVESLNVSVTGAILLEHAISGRPGDLSEAERAYLYARALVLTIPRAPEILAVLGINVEI